MSNLNTENVKQHSMLSPSSSSIWLNCTPSAAMMALVPNEDTVFTTEGTDAHALCERKIKALLKAMDEGTEYSSVGLSEGLESYNDEMDMFTDDYVDHAYRIISRAEENGYVPTVFAEHALDISKYIPEGKGTADLLIIEGDTLHVIDFKYGAFKRVDAEENTQMMTYAVAAMDSLADEFGTFNKVVMTIVQPRLANISTYSSTSSALYKWANKVLAPGAAIAYKGEGELNVGDHCMFCSAKNLCRKYREEQIKAIKILSPIMNKYKSAVNALKKDKTMDKETLQRAKDNLLSNKEIVDALRLGAGVGYWLDNLKEIALRTALEGSEYPGMKLIEVTTPSKVGEAVVPILEKLGIDPYKPRTLKSKTELERELGKKVFADQVLPNLDEGEKKPNLVFFEDKGEAKPYTYFQDK